MGALRLTKAMIAAYEKRGIVSNAAKDWPELALRTCGQRHSINGKSDLCDLISQTTCSWTMHDKGPRLSRNERMCHLQCFARVSLEEKIAEFLHLLVVLKVRAPFSVLEKEQMLLRR